MKGIMIILAIVAPSVLLIIGAERFTPEEHFVVVMDTLMAIYAFCIICVLGKRSFVNRKAQRVSDTHVLLAADIKSGVVCNVEGITTMRNAYERRDIWKKR